MSRINSVLGPIDSKDMGFTLMHEHILVMSGDMKQAFLDRFGRKAYIDQSVTELRKAKEFGVQTIIDATPVNLGRDIHIMREVSEKVEINIIASTGLFWHENPQLKTTEVNRLVDRLIIDIEKGIQGTDSKAGIIKCATDNNKDIDFNHKLLQVASRLHKHSGIPITTHSSVEEQTGLFQLDIFGDEGVDLRKVIIGHIGDTNDLNFIEQIFKRGCFIGLDRFGSTTFNTFENRIHTLTELCKRGWTNQIVLSHDYSICTDFNMTQFDKKAYGKNDIDEYKKTYYLIPKKVIPTLLMKSITKDQIELMMIKNPLNIFEQ